ncbi:membrane protein [Thiosulfatimonas sediminis]|uniref:Membrane protein n=1 Tax=Thiosulfatimonas sediminis TaxID=2675054 RepID=A0A6F8PUZ3_9GAMM|nr:DMT family transporter [Thiosulfatimonas sediminis]BBP45945.1 membrane protein [Thiosulfatimonas sediminis]
MLIVAAYISVVLIWTTTPLAIVWGGSGDWFFAVALRTTLAALLILPFAFWFGVHKRWSFKPSVLKIYLFAALPIFGGMTAMYWAGQSLPSGWIALLFALNPIFSGVLAHYLLPNYQLNGLKILAILISLCGLVVIFAPNLSMHLATIQLLAIGAAFLSVFFHSLGSVLIKRCGTHLSSLDVVVAALLVSSATYLLLSPTQLFDVENYLRLSERAMAAIVYAAVIGSLIGFVLFFYLVRHVDAMKVALIPVITPVFAILLGHFLNDEPLGWDVWFGVTLVLAGLVLFQRQK